MTKAFFIVLSLVFSASLHAADFCATYSEAKGLDYEISTNWDPFYSIYRQWEAASPLPIEQKQLCWIFGSPDQAREYLNVGGIRKIHCEIFNNFVTKGCAVK